MRRTLTSPLVAALTGGLIVAVAFAVVDPRRNAGTRTVVEQAPMAMANPDSLRGQSALTPRQIYERAAPAVVYVRSTVVQDVQSPFDLFSEQQRSESTGSGFVIDDQGRILTNYHVIAGASDISVSFAGDKATRASVVGTDPSNDLALLKVAARPATLHPLALGDSAGVAVGDPTLAIGNPFGLDRTLTSGIVSALQRRIRAPNGFQIDHVIQTDAAINPGNSGGPLLDAAGRVIGINSQIATGGSGSDGSIGIGFAVPINTAKRELPELEGRGTVARAYLGVDGVTLSAALARDAGVGPTSGVLVEDVRRGSPAARAGLRGGRTQAEVNGHTLKLGGDAIMALDGRSVRSIEDLVNRVGDHGPGDRVRLTYRRPGAPTPVTVTVTLRARPSGAPTS
jgi:S1-C subfamily serine protease